MKTTRRTGGFQFVSFFIGDRLFGLDIHVVKEVNPSTEIAPVPLSQRCFRGLVNIRGQIVLVVDMGMVLEGQPMQVTGESQLVILKTAPELCNTPMLDGQYDTASFGDKPVSLLVDRIGDVLNIAVRDMEEAPAHLSERAAALVAQVVHLNDGLLTVLNAEAILKACDAQSVKKASNDNKMKMSNFSKEQI